MHFSDIYADRRLPEEVRSGGGAGAACLLTAHACSLRHASSLRLACA